MACPKAAEWENSQCRILRGEVELASDLKFVLSGLAVQERRSQLKLRLNFSMCIHPDILDGFGLLYEWTGCHNETVLHSDYI